MHRKLIVLAGMFCAVSAKTERVFPKSGATDKEHMMRSEAYWKLWNDSVQQKKDTDIYANRKADAHELLEGAATGTEINVERDTAGRKQIMEYVLN